MIRILIIDDHQLFAAGLRHMLMDAFDSAHIECHHKPDKAINDSKKPDLVILDFYIPGFQAIDTIKKLLKNHHKTKIVIISSSVSTSDRKDCLDAGATAYFEKHLPPETVLTELTNVLRSGCVNTAQKPFIELKNQRYGLGMKKTEILVLLARGYSNKKMAQRLKISPETVKTHLTEIYQLLQVSSRDQASQWAIEHGLI